MVYGSALAWDSATPLLAPLLSMTLFFHTVFERHFGDAWREVRRRMPRLAPFTTPGGKT